MLFKYFFKKKNPVPVKQGEIFPGANLQLTNKQLMKWELQMAKKDEVPYIMFAIGKNNQDSAYFLDGLQGQNEEYLKFIRSRLITIVRAIDRGAKIKDLSNLKK